MKAILLVLLMGVSSYADVVINKVDQSYRVELTKNDLSSLKAAIPTFMNISVQLQDAKWKIFEAELDGSSSKYGTMSFGGLDQALLSDERSPYRRIIKDDGSSRLRLQVSTADLSWIKDFYSALQVPAVKRGSKFDKKWVSADGVFKIFCTQFTMPIVASHTCSFSLLEPKP